MLPPGPRPRVDCPLCYRNVAQRKADGAPREHKCQHGKPCTGLPVNSLSCAECVSRYTFFEPADRASAEVVK